MEKWFVAAKKADFESWSEKFHISPVTARIIRNRDVVTKEGVQKYLYGTLADLYDPMLLKDMDKAVEVILNKIQEKKVIRIIGDYDVDGICSAHILTKGLRTIGAIVDTAIPHRIRDGYGLNEQLILEAHEAGVDTIITCDNGIAAAPQIAYAWRLGMTVVVTDHHEVPFKEENGVRTEILPPAAAVVDPKRSDCSYPYPGICGGMVAYKVICALYRKIKEQNPQMQTPQMQEVLEELLQFAAIATICDVMELLDENRIVVKEGLKRIRQNPVEGILALMEVNGIEPENINAYHVGFIIGPCMNATGRLDTALRALELLNAQKKQEALAIAGELKELNDSRKLMTQKGVDGAVKYVEEKGLLEEKVLVVYLPDCHESLAGIIAGRIREKYGKPVFVLTKGEEGVKGSGRSIESYHMYEAMVACQELFTKFGGHKMAAGLSMEEKNVELFAAKINETCTLTEDDFVSKVHIDVPMPLELADKKMAKELEVLEPFGVANPKPLFARKDVHFLSASKMGKTGLYAKFVICEEGSVCKEAVYFGEWSKFAAVVDEKYGDGAAEKLFVQKCNYELAVTYQIGVNSFRGKEEVQIVLQNFC
ncbi:MAG: single-stranded-DNA-specific exonuclease RecJ [Lachnospiraceae bacterium]|nr:single-stranded-DNA-specific exonuclease RecJ [Lachnospiraceae bacterium]